MFNGSFDVVNNKITCYLRHFALSAEHGRTRWKSREWNKGSKATRSFQFKIRNQAQKNTIYEYKKVSFFEQKRRFVA